VSQGFARRSGFTPVDLPLVIPLISILTALSLPARQRVREAAAKTIKLLGHSMRFAAVSLGLLFISTHFTEIARAQHSVEASARYYHLICLVHLTGSGLKGDPILPEYVPAAANVSRSGILAWKMQLTDDKTMAIIHIVAASRSAFQGVLSDKRPEVLVFEPGVQTKAAIDLALQKFSKNFSLSTFEVLAR
jgi:hypothetical protein